jgi:hypothetical protein
MDQRARRRLYDIAANRLKKDLRLVSHEPTERQCAAGARAGGVGPEVARAVYEAMLAADEAP